MQLSLFDGNDEGGSRRRHPTSKFGKWMENDCEHCGARHGWYESTLRNTARGDLCDWYRRLCKGCRKPYVSVVKAHHLSTAQAFRLMATTHCELCGEKLPRPNGRTGAVVDHLHSHCPHDTSCGHCIRGFLCRPCNVAIGQIEKVARHIGIEHAIAWIDRALLERD